MTDNTTKNAGFFRPGKVGLYDPANEKDACGVGFVASIKGDVSHQIVTDALTLLRRMEHRGACGCEENTGDGAGILTSMPDKFFRRIAKQQWGVDLPPLGEYGVGTLFLPPDMDQRIACINRFTRIAREHGLEVLGWRAVPTDNSMIGPSAKASEPVMFQAFINRPDDMERSDFCRKLFIVRKRVYHDVRTSGMSQAEYYYCCSLSTRVIVYKGQLTATQLDEYYPDLREADFHSYLAMVHSRFSTNTFPSWERAQPMRYMSHNGEINTLRGNVNWMRARQGLLESEVFGDELEGMYPIVDPETSDSGTFDNVMELTLLAGRPLPEVVMMMVPEAWENHDLMDPTKKAFYRYHANLMEPWDGPASVVFTDGRYIGAVLDRNGLRPSRYYITEDDRVIMASEVGAVDVPPENIRFKGRLEPGRMFLVDFDQSRIIDDLELKQEIASKRPYSKWLDEQVIELSELDDGEVESRYDSDQLLRRMQAFGYTTEHVDFLMKPMAENGGEPLGSMGNDTALACLSDHPRLTYDYFKQLFAQVTNPPIDPIRESIVMSLECFIGPEGNLLTTTSEQCHRMHLPQPVLTNRQLASIRAMDHRGWRAKTIDMTYALPKVEKDEDKVDVERAAMLGALDRICQEATEAIDEGYSLVVLSDRNVGDDRVALSALVATGAVHHHLVSTASRTRLGIIVESAEPREVHHYCCLVGYGADAVNPYLAFEALWQLRRDELIDPEKYSDDQVAANYIKAIGKGILKVMSKMGISTLASYKGAQIFEAVGLKDTVVDRCFEGTASRLQGVDFGVLATEARRRHEIGYPPRSARRLPVLTNPGDYQWRSGGEKHSINPGTVATLQQAARNNNQDAYWQYAKLINEDSRNRATLRGLLRFKKDESKAISIDDVEPAKEIVKRFRTGAMSFGALSKEAHETLAVAMNRIGGMSNSGEGGEDPARFHVLSNGDSKRSAIKQIASGRFGVTSYYLANAQVLQIKMAQGAKPGEGGQLPGFKVDREIARVRYSTPGVGLISPPPHHDIYSIEDLAQLIYDLKNANPDATVSVKLVSEVGVGTIAAGVAKAHADHILISGDSGGTGASPLTSIKHAGLPWELGLAEAHQTLVLNDLRSRVRLEVDGGLKTGRDVAIGALLGAEEFGFSTMPLIALGCIMMRKCHLNTCPVGICTQDPELRKKFKGTPEHVVNYLFMIAEELRQIMAGLGIATVDDLIGRVDLLEADDAIKHWKSDGLDLQHVLSPAVKSREDVGVRRLIDQDHGLDKALDQELIERAKIALDDRTPVRFESPIKNTNRAVGTMLSHLVSKKHGEHGLPDDTISIKFYGSAGQSFGAFAAHGVTLELEGDANDYVGKGLSGGKLIVYPPKSSRFVPEENILIGNVSLYGATGGYAYYRGVAGERFCVRNSGAHAVVEGIGDHGCEYMTGGRVAVLGSTGRNFGAGMSGGIAYVYDPEKRFAENCNHGSIDLETIEHPDYANELRKLITLHLQHTGSEVAAQILADFDRRLDRFVMVMPREYRSVLEAKRNEKSSPDESRVTHG